MADNYSETLNLPKTDFPMRASLPAKEPEILEKWGNIYHEILESKADKKPFILHDGPPFANGDIHMGHALNKILKDIVIKSKSMAGFSTPYIPGWDTHGLPIERQAIKAGARIQDSGVSEDASKANFRARCEDFAKNYVEKQREQFKRLGIFADWDNPYLTLQPEYEAAQIRVFGEMVAKNYIYRGLKPVYWCTDCETALAEAEIEYAEHTAESIFVKFPVVKMPSGDKMSPLQDASIAIWTTTPWTLPANVAIALGADFDYVLVNANGEKLILAKDLADKVMNAAGIDNYDILAEFKGRELERVECRHPFIDRNSLVINADLVTLESGTGCVHIAPGHGAEDYFACQAYPEIPIVVPIDGKGVLTDEAGPFAGQYYEKANKAIKDYLDEHNFLLASEQMQHSYPHCWRCKEPIIFRAAEQWFCSIDSFKEQALAEIKKVNWIPKWGEDRIANMVADRADWCISRQRLWGMPIPVFYCEDTGEPILDKKVIDYVADIFKKEGSNAWFEKDAKDLLPPGYKCEAGCSQFRKETDTMDVWFDSGTSHSGVVEARFG
ncbi:MAG: isoleucine--tRNA ligase, partial [Oscillospiraceae bacterium]|nr:isoleucine--tRNA ligase [Oscillospiraceae bacterium]